MGSLWNQDPERYDYEYCLYCGMFHKKGSKVLKEHLKKFD